MEPPKGMCGHRVKDLVGQDSSLMSHKHTGPQEQGRTHAWIRQAEPRKTGQIRDMGTVMYPVGVCISKL